MFKRKQSKPTVHKDWRGRIIIKDLDTYHRILLEAKRRGRVRGYNDRREEEARRAKAKRAPKIIL